MPIKRFRRRQWWAPLAFGLLLAVGLLAPLPHGSRTLGTLTDAAHGPLFAVFGFLVYRTLLRVGRLKPVTTAWITWLALILLGSAAEVAQNFVARGPSVKDAVTDALGSLAGVLWALAAQSPHCPRPRTLRTVALAVLGLGLIPGALSVVDTVIQAREFPLIGSFEQPLELLRWKNLQSRIHRDAQSATDGDWSLRVDLRAGQAPGLCIGSVSRDWSGYGELVLDVYLDEGPPLDWIVFIEDQFFSYTWGRCYERVFHLRPGQQRLVIPLAEVARGSGKGPVDLRRIGLLVLFTKELREPRTIWLDNIRLQ